MSTDNRIRIREAVELAKARGQKIKKNVLARKIFPGTTDKSATVCLNNYERGQTTKMDKIQITALCRELGVDGNFLFDTPPMINNTQKENEDGKQKRSEGRNF